MRYEFEGIWEFSDNSSFCVDYREEGFWWLETGKAFLECLKYEEFKGENEGLCFKGGESERCAHWTVYFIYWDWQLAQREA